MPHNKQIWYLNGGAVGQNKLNIKGRQILAQLTVQSDWGRIAGQAQQFCEHFADNIVNYTHTSYNNHSICSTDAPGANIRVFEVSHLSHDIFVGASQVCAPATPQNITAKLSQQKQANFENLFLKTQRGDSDRNQHLSGKSLSLQYSSIKNDLYGLFGDCALH
jgi:hypothetical protein